MKWKKDHLKEGAWTALLSVAGCGLLLYSRPVSAAVTDSLGLCANVLLPTLFPFFVLSSLLTECRFPARARGLMPRLLGLPNSMTPAVVLGAVGGYPVGARTVAQLYVQGRCSKEQAVQALAFCNNAGPAFVIGAIGGGMLADGRLGLRLWLVHLCSALLIAVLGKRKSAVV